MPACYTVEHETRYLYATPVSTSRHVAYLRPREVPYQRVRQAQLDIDPGPVETSRRTDYFGNTVQHFTLLTPHTELLVRARSVVEVSSRGLVIDPGSSPPWEHVRDALRFGRGAAPGEDSQFAYPSTYVAVDPALADFALTSFTPGRPFLAAVLELTHRIHTGFRYVPNATTITTPVSRVLAERQGVCQDFAHLQISCLRSLGLAARYVSGYLLTDPPPGAARLLGVDASHAWLAVRCPRHGWVDVDPTNDVVPALRHVTLAWGRDYADVTPLRGVVLGGGEHTLHVGVNVRPLDETEWDPAAASSAPS